MKDLEADRRKNPNVEQRYIQMMKDLFENNTSIYKNIEQNIDN